jgi:hypothetical protein
MIITGFGVSAKVGGKVTCKFPFTINGALSLTIA